MILNAAHPNPDTCCMLLANLTREPSGGRILLQAHHVDSDPAGKQVKKLLKLEHAIHLNDVTIIKICNFFRLSHTYVHTSPVFFPSH